MVNYNPFAAGGVTDSQLRYMTEKVGKVRGQPILMEVKAGAAGFSRLKALLFNALASCYTLQQLGLWAQGY
jgi:tripartite-type tricarboxylate transporter receptor subunit TctC